MSFLAEFLKLSPGSQAVVIALIGSVVYVVLGLVLSILRAAAAIVRTLVSRRPAKTAQPTSSEDLTPRKQKQQQAPGVSLKQLQREAAKGKSGHGAPADRHASSKLFLTGLRGHCAEVTGLAWSPDGEKLATACDDRTVRVFDLRDLTAKSLPCRKRELRVGVQDVAFGDDDTHVAVLTKGIGNSAGLVMLDFSPQHKEPLEEWVQEGVHNKMPGLCLASASTSKGGYGILASSSNKTDLRVYSTSGRLLGTMDTGGLNNYMATISRDGRWVAAGTFTSDVYEVQFDRLGGFTGVKLAMALTKGHKSKVFCLDFSPDLTKMVTASGDGMLKIWNINVRYHMQEDPKVLLSTGLSLLPGKCYSRLAWGPEGLIAGACGTMLHLLDARTGEVVERVEDAHEAEITSLAWSSSRLRGPNGPTAVLATAGMDGRVRLWATPQRLV